LPWARITEASTFAAVRKSDALGLLGDHYGQLRRYAPAVLKAFEFQAAPAVAPLLDGVDTLRALNASGTRTVPAGCAARLRAPDAGAVCPQRGRLLSQVLRTVRHAELKNALRAGDVWVAGSRQFRDFDEYLIERAAFTAQAETAATGII
jgi:hypothetical protein